MSINKNGEIWRRSIDMHFPSGSEGKESSCNGEDEGSIPGVWKIPWRSGMATHINIHAWHIPMTSWVWYCIIVALFLLGENCSTVHRTSLLFLASLCESTINSKKKFNLKIFTSSIFTDMRALNVVFWKKGHILLSIFSLQMRIYKWRIIINLPSYALNLLPFYTVNLDVQHQGDI